MCEPDDPYTQALVEAARMGVETSPHLQVEADFYGTAWPPTVEFPQ